MRDLASWALARSAPSWREVALAALLFVALGAAVCGAHIATDSFYSDDWPNAAMYAFEAEPGLDGALAHALERRFFDYRPVAAVAIALQHEMLGLSPALHLAMAVALGALTSAGVFALLRTLRLEPMHAYGIAALFLVFPWAAATRLWPTASLNTLAVLLWVAGVLAALRSLGTGGRAALLGHAAAMALYALAILMYEVAAGFVAATALLYLARAPGRAALRRWIADLATVTGTLLLMAANTPRSPEPFADQLGHAGRIAEEAVVLLGRAAAPLPRPGTVPEIGVVVVLMAVVAAAALAALRGRIGAGDAARIRRWLGIVALGTVGIAGGYLLIVPGYEAFSPLTPGVLSRVNTFAALGFVTVAYSGVLLAAKLVVATMPRLRRPLPLLAGLAVLAIGVGYVLDFEARTKGWERSAEQQRAVLAAVDGLPPLESGAVVFTFGTPIHAAPGVPVFRHKELRAAVQIRLGRSDVAAYPMYPEAAVKCGEDAMWAEGAGYGRWDPEAPPDGFILEAAGSYGASYLLDVKSGRWEAIDSRFECRTRRNGYRPGPLTLDADTPLRHGP